MEVEEYTSVHYSLMGTLQAEELQHEPVAGTTRPGLFLVTDALKADHVAEVMLLQET